MRDEERPRQRPEVETHLLPDGTCLLFDNRTEMGHVLNAVAALVWDYCDGMLTEAQIADEVAALLPSAPGEPGGKGMRDDVARLFADLRSLDLLESYAPVPAESPTPAGVTSPVDDTPGFLAG